MSIKLMIIEVAILIPLFMLMRWTAFNIDEQKGKQIDRFGFICYLLGTLLDMLFNFIQEGIK